MEVLSDLKRRGLACDPAFAVADGGLGFWAALRKVFTTTREQRCWVHKTANVLNKVHVPTQQGPRLPTRPLSTIRFQTTLVYDD